MTAKADQRAAGMLAGVELAAKQSEADARLAVEARRPREVEMMRLADVLGRPGGLDTRQPTEAALDALAESIDALGLLEPLVVDRLGSLLCGKTRLMALRRLACKDPARWDRVPVRRMDFMAEDEPARALAVEVAENEQRRDYTPGEVKALAERLKAAGFRADPGRPRKGQKALVPALGAVVGRSRASLMRILAGDDAGKDAAGSAGDGGGETVSSETVFRDAAARLARALVRHDAATADCALDELTNRQRQINAGAAALLGLCRLEMGE
jgi:hypothetical protein